LLSHATCTATTWQLLARVVGEKDDWVINYFSNFIDGDLFASCYAATEFNNELRACLNISPWATYIASIYWALVGRCVQVLNPVRPIARNHGLVSQPSNG
jgi:hypothetical protein